MIRLSGLALVLVVAVGCSATSTGTAAPTISPRIHITLADTLRIDPASLSVPAGVPVTFVATNSGGKDHEFYVGDEEAQARHEREMQSMAGMTHDEPNGIAVDPGQTKELTMRFDQPGETLAGCHVAGHYAGGSGR